MGVTEAPGASADTYARFGWETLHSAVAWFPFGSALPESLWDHYLCPGASDWLGPSDAASMLLLYMQFGAKDPDGLPRWLINRLRAARRSPSKRQASKDELGVQERAMRQAAERMLQSLAAEGSPSPEEMYDAS